MGVRGEKVGCERRDWGERECGCERGGRETGVRVGRERVGCGRDMLGMRGSGV